MPDLRQFVTVRRYCYTPSGELFATESQDNWKEFDRKQEECPKSFFKFNDFDGTEVVASCFVLECKMRRWFRYFKWLGLLFPTKRKRHLVIRYSTPIGTQKHEKRGVVGNCVEMTKYESAEQSFRNFISGKPYLTRGVEYIDYRLSYIGPCDPPQK